MRFASALLVLGSVAFACGEPASGDLFAPTGTQGTSGPTTSTGSPTGSNSTMGAGGSDSSGSAGAATGSAGAGGDTSSTTAAGGNGGSGGDPVGSGAGGASGGMGGATTGGASGGNMGGASGSAGGGMGGAGGASSVDGGTPHPVHCGTTSCTAQKEFCCIQDAPGGTTSARCVANGSFCSDNADRVYCDDRSDCTGSEICCASDNLSGGSSTAACALPAQCVNLMRKTQQLCDPQQPNPCPGISMINPCRLDTNATIPGYAYCH